MAVTTSTLSATVLSVPATSGGEEPPCAASGVTTIPSAPGARSGPPAAIV